MEVEQLFYSNDQRVYNLISQLCAVDHSLCNVNLKLISEKNNTVNNLERMPIVMGHFPSGTSVKNMDHFNQYMSKASFCRYDYGQKQN